MIRGTTPQLTFTLPFEVGTLSTAYLTFSQNNNIVVEKTLNECAFEGNKLIVKLTQEDTLKFKTSNTYNKKTKVEIQLRAKTTGGDVVASKVCCCEVEKILKDGVI